MSPKDIIALGALLFIVAYYLNFHPYWLAFFAFVILMGCGGTLLKTRRAKKKRDPFADIQPFDSKKKKSRRH